MTFLELKFYDYFVFVLKQHIVRLRVKTVWIQLFFTDLRSSSPLHHLSSICISSSINLLNMGSMSRDVCLMVLNACDGNRSHSRDRWSLYQHRPMIDHLWHLPTKNVFSDYCYSISLIKYFKSMFDKSNEKNKIVFYIFFHLLWSLGI